MAATALAVGMIAATVSNTISQRESILAKGTVDESIARREARISRIRAAEAIKRGERSVEGIEIRKRQLAGVQKAALAAQGIDPNTGTGASVIQESLLFGDLDIMEVRNNARLEAFGFEAQALTSEGRGRFAKLSARAGARATLLTGGLSIARDLAMFGVHKAGKSRVGGKGPNRIKFKPRNPTEARFNRDFVRRGNVTDVGFAR